VEVIAVSIRGCDWHRELILVMALVKTWPAHGLVMLLRNHRSLLEAHAVELGRSSLGKEWGRGETLYWGFRGTIAERSSEGRDRETGGSRRVVEGRTSIETVLFRGSHDDPRNMMGLIRRHHINMTRLRHDRSRAGTLQGTRKMSNRSPVEAVMATQVEGRASKRQG
jgi:hypothetical protein